MNRIALQVGLVCVALFGLAACGDPEPIINIPDSSTPDSGGGGGVDSGPVVEPDSGPEPDTCPPARGPAPMAAQLETCSAATRACFDAATSQAAYNACITGDATNGMNCALCLSAELINTCSAPDICDEQFGEVQCCLQDECASRPAAEQQACANAAIGPSGACASEWSTFTGCVNTSAMMTPPLCGNTDICNMEEPPPAAFAPDFSRRSSRFFVPDLRDALRFSIAR